jgi:transposase InsO family protein
MTDFNIPHVIFELFLITLFINEKWLKLSPSKTALALWEKAVARFWTRPHKKKGRPPLSNDVRQLILKLKLENPHWGLRRVRDELKKLSIRVSHETISRVIRHFRKTREIKPSGAWKRFLSSHWEVLFACDFLTVTVFGMTTFYVFFIIKLETREIIRFGVTDHPNIQFLRNQFSDFEQEHPGSYLIHDNSGELRHFPYSQYNFKDVAIVPYSPNMNAYAERFVRSIRQECLNHFIVFTYRQLHRLVRAYVGYYNNYRPHQGLKGIPKGSQELVQKTGQIRRKPLLFGLHSHYYREAA